MNEKKELPSMTSSQAAKHAICYMLYVISFVTDGYLLTSFRCGGMPYAILSSIAALSAERRGAINQKREVAGRMWSKVILHRQTC